MVIAARIQRTSLLETRYQNLNGEYDPQLVVLSSTTVATGTDCLFHSCSCKALVCISWKAAKLKTARIRGMLAAEKKTSSTFALDNLRFTLSDTGSNKLTVLSLHRRAKAAAPEKVAMIIAITRITA